MKFPSTRLLLTGSVLALLCSPVAWAASQSWDGGSISTGAWNTNANWLGDPTPPGATSGTTNTDVATFNAPITNSWGTIAGNPVIVDSGRNLGGITFTGTSGNFFVGSTSGSALLLSSGGTTQISSGLTATNVTATINAPLQLQGAGGTYSLINDSANTGVGSGTLKFGGAISGAAAGSTVLTLSGTNQNDNRLSGAVSNGSATSLAVLKSGTGSWTLAGNNSYSGGTTINGGTLYVANNDTALGLGNVAFTGAGSLETISNQRSLANNVTLTAGIAGRFGAGGGTLTLNGLLSGTGSLLTTSTGTVAVTNANTFTGATVVGTGSASVLSINTIADIGSATANALGMPTAGSTTIQLTSNATLQYTGSSLGSSNRVISLQSNGGSYGLDASGDTTFALSGGISSPATSGTNTLTLSGTTTGSESGVIANGTGTNITAVTKSGTGSWTLSGPNTFTGDVAVNAGTLKVASIAPNGTAQPLGRATTVIALSSYPDVGTLEYTGATAANLERDITVNETGGVSNPSYGGFISNSGGNTLTLSGTLTLLTGSARLTLSGGTFNVTGKITGGTANFNVSNAVATLSNAANDYTGTMQVIGGGTLKNGVTNALSPTTSLVVGGGSGSASGTYDLNGFDATVASLFSGGTAILGRIITNDATGTGTNTLTVTGGSIWGGIIRDGATAKTALTVNGGGYLTLIDHRPTDINTYSGDTTVSDVGSALQLSDNASFANSKVIHLGTGTTLDVASLSGGNNHDGTAFSLMNGQTLKGTGTVFGAMHVASGATLAPGESIGTLNANAVSFLGTANYQLEINTLTVQSDQLSLSDSFGPPFPIAGNFSLDLANTVTLSLNDLGPGLPLAPNTVLTIIDYSATWNGGTFAGHPDDSTFVFGPNTFLISYNGVNGSTSAVTLQAVPEPGTAPLLALGGVSALLVRRRRTPLARS